MRNIPQHEPKRRGTVTGCPLVADLLGGDGERGEELGVVAAGVNLDALRLRVLIAREDHPAFLKTMM